MAFKVINSSRFAAHVGGLLKDYEQDIGMACYEVINEVTSNAVAKLKTAGSFKGRKFRKAWTRTVKQHTSGYVEAYVHLKKPYYRIGHLLEHGHAIVTGGRKVGDATAFRFIKPVANEAEEEYTRKMIDMIGKVV